MAEIVEYRVEKTIDELNLLVNFGLFSKQHAKEILAKRENFEYILRRRNRTKLDFLKYIRFEVNLLESIEKYKKTVLNNYYKAEKSDKIEDLDRKILLLQAKKLNDVLRCRCAHISSLFRKLTNHFQFDKKLWLVYIEFAKSRNWNTRVSSLYWRVLRVSGDDQDIWLAAASHEVDVNRAFDTARGLYLRALRHHPKSSKVWAEYFKMEVKFMDIVDQRARIIFKTVGGIVEDKKEDGDVWAEKEAGELKDPVEDEPQSDNDDEEKVDNDGEALPEAKPVDEDDTIISGHLPKVVYNNAAQSLDSNSEYRSFVVAILTHILSNPLESKGQLSLKEYVCADIRKRSAENDPRIPADLADYCDSLEFLKEYTVLDIEGENSKPSKKLKRNLKSKIEILYECYETKGLNEARKVFEDLERSVKNQTLSLYVGMIQVESWQLAKDKSDSQRNRIRSLYDKALTKFGKTKPKLWYEYLQFEHDNAKSLDDFERINQLYLRAQSTLHSSKVDRVIEKYTLLQVKSSGGDLEYSDYSDLED